jgi:hypothetical protein
VQFLYTFLAFLGHKKRLDHPKKVALVQPPPHRSPFVPPGSVECFSNACIRPPRPTAPSAAVRRGRVPLLAGIAFPPDPALLPFRTPAPPQSCRRAQTPLLQADFLFYGGTSSTTTLACDVRFALIEGEIPHRRLARVHFVARPRANSRWPENQRCPHAFDACVGSVDRCHPARCRLSSLRTNNEIGSDRREARSLRRSAASWSRSSERRRSPHT